MCQPSPVMHHVSCGMYHVSCIVVILESGAVAIARWLHGCSKPVAAIYLAKHDVLTHKELRWHKLVT